jgi:ubiquinol-cytochrome c reductase cytochrome b subunit
LFVADCFLLAWIGSRPVETPYIEVGQILTLYFFVFLLILVPLLGRIETFLLTYQD